MSRRKSYQIDIDTRTLPADVQKALATSLNIVQVELHRALELHLRGRFSVDVKGRRLKATITQIEPDDAITDFELLESMVDADFPKFGDPRHPANFRSQRSFAPTECDEGDDESDDWSSGHYE